MKPPLAVSDEALLYLSTNEGIVATTIEFKTKDMLQQERKTGRIHSHTHALCLVKKATYYYLFDPNGPVISGQGKDYHEYIYESLSFTSRKFITRLCSKYNIPTDRFVYEKKNLGIQGFSPEEDNTEFIKQGGYCMFYLHWFINYIAEPANWTNAIIAAIITEKYSPSNSGIFPPKNDVPAKSKEVIITVMTTIFRDRPDLIRTTVCPPDI